MRRSASLVVGLALLCGASTAAAAGREGVVVAIEGEDVFVDLGRADGAAPGERLSLQRLLRVRHPSNGRRLEESFELGTLEVVEAGLSISRTRAERARRPPAIGDRVVGATAPPPSPAEPRWDALLHDCPPPPPPAELSLVSTFAHVAGRPPEERARAWRELLSAGVGLPPEARAAIERELQSLAAWEARLRAAEERRVPRLPDAIAVAPTELFEHEPALVTILLPDGAEVHAPRLWFRAEGASGFSSVPLADGGDGALRAKLPEAALVPPGVAWFASDVGPAGERALAHEAEAPAYLPISTDPRGAGGDEGRSRVALYGEEVRFDGTSEEERFARTEATFLYRVLSPALYGVSLGFGTWDGATAASGPVRLRYGAAGLELHASESFGLVGRVLAGNGPDGLSRGLEGQLRLGRERGTSLVVGASTTDSIGDAASLQLGWDTVPGLPMAGQVVVLRLPGDDELRVRLVHEVRRALSDHVELALRSSFNARDADHFGLGLGLGTVFSW